ncbi:hypothetical protein [Nocardiopsis chromatogenes]|uniref:hypothetical protein n=1 Tax=Nocardiopsis chromatogenes TaxID=280239 RepID=UPI000345A3E2|nr:hypothetical protein [Nocardiopsis chromatogenes]
MFEGLDGIDWGALESGCGGSDIPDLIRGLLDPEPQIREDSFGDLEIELLEFGYIHEAAVRAVPFLAEAATAEGVPDLLERWRGDYGELVPPLGGLLDDPDPAVASLAAERLRGLHG